VNKLLENSRASRGKYPLGVSLHKQTGKFNVRCCDGDGGYPYLGLYRTVDEAFAVYKNYKESVIKKVADRHKTVLSRQAYLALYNWEVSADD
jgi:hypothetical protein